MSEPPQEIGQRAFAFKASISLKESRETHYWLRLLAASEVIAESQLEPLLDECDQIIAILTTIVKKIKARKE